MDYEILFEVSLEHLPSRIGAESAGLEEPFGECNV